MKNKDCTVRLALNVILTYQVHVSIVVIGLNMHMTISDTD